MPKLNDIFSVKIIEDSVAEHGGRITSFQLSLPLFIWPEVLTHKKFSRSASSLRATPIGKVLNDVLANPIEPLHWGKAQKGMQAERTMNPIETKAAQGLWRSAMRQAVRHAQDLSSDVDAAKQIANRVVTPFVRVHAIITSTDYENFFALRTHPAAEPHIRALAWLMADAYYQNEPTKQSHHLPYITQEERSTLDMETVQKASMARCARVSYVLHDGTKPSLEKDLALADRLMNPSNGTVPDDMEPPHMSPAEHQATAHADPNHKSGNLDGWVQHRQTLPKNVMRFDYNKARELGWRDLAFQDLTLE